MVSLAGCAKVVEVEVMPPSCPHAGAPLANEVASFDVSKSILLFDYLARMERFCKQIERLRKNG